MFISFESSCLGDSIAWIPYCLEFKKMYECDVVVSTFKNFLFENVYPELEFVGRGVTVDNVYGVLKIGWFYNNNSEPVHPAKIPLQKTICNIIRVPFVEIQPRIAFTPKERPIEEKYITIATQSTAQCKLWYHWTELIDHLTSKGYKVVEVSKENVMYDNLINPEDKDLESTMNYIHHSEFFIGLSSGLSWLSWGIGKHVVMISNFTEEGHEFTTNCTRIINKNVCHGCWNNTNFLFDKGDWNWCPIHKGSDRAFECHIQITAQQVIDAIPI
jgi:autotransporter strand-loop-strand O-heptosyltransferase